MKTKIVQLEDLVNANGTDKMKELVSIAKNYMEVLDKLFYAREISNLVLQEMDFPMFLEELKREGKFENKSGMLVKLLVMDVFFIVRHIWELDDARGNKKTGCDLVKAFILFPDEELLDVESVYDNLKHLPSVSM